MPKIVKNTTFISPIDLLAPHSCRGCGCIGNVLCDRCKNYILSTQHNFCPKCKQDNPSGHCDKCQDLPPTFIAGERSGLLGDLVHDYKYHSIRALAKPLAEIMHHALPPIGTKVVLIPLPTISQHIRTRGFDHTYLIAKHLARLHPNYQVKRLLARARNTVQVGANRSARLQQANAAYTLAPDFTPDPDAAYILFDDVWTTGASLTATTNLLKSAGAKNIILAILAVSRID